MRSTHLCIALFFVLGLSACKGKKTEEAKTKPNASKETPAKTPVRDEAKPVEEAKAQTIHIKKGRIEIESKLIAPDTVLATLKSIKGPIILSLYKDTPYKEFKGVIQQLVLAKIAKVVFADENGSKLLACALKENFKSTPATKIDEVLVFLFDPARNGSPLLATSSDILAKNGEQLEAGLERLKKNINFDIEESKKGVDIRVNLACGDAVPLGNLSKVLRAFGQLKLTNVCFGSLAVVVEEKVEIDRTPPKGTDTSKSKDR